MNARRILDNAISEREFQEQLRQLCKLTGHAYYHTHDSRRSPEGFPDAVIVGPDHANNGAQSVMFMELKTTRGQLSPKQRDWLDRINCAIGVRADLFRPSDWPWLKYMLSGVDDELEDR